MMHQHPCDEIRERLEAYHDGELLLDEQVAIQGHLTECVGCSLAIGATTSSGCCGSTPRSCGATRAPRSWRAWTPGCRC